MASFEEPDLTDDDSDYIADSYEKTGDIEASLVIDQSYSDTSSPQTNSRKINASSSHKRESEAFDESVLPRQSTAFDESIVRVSKPKNRPILETDDEEDDETDVEVQKVPQIESDSDDDEEDEDEEICVSSSSSDSLHSIENSPGTSNKYRFSKDFGPQATMMNSTAIGGTKFGITQKTPSRNFELKDSMTTPRIVKQDISSRSPSPSLEDDDVVAISSDESRPKTPKEPVIQVDVSPREYKDQKEKIQRIHSDLMQARNIARTMNLSTLPDKGEMLQNRLAKLEALYERESKKLDVMNVSKEDPPPVRPLGEIPVANWADIKAGVAAVQPKTFGKQAMATYNAQKALTVDRLHQLHGSLEKCPKEDTMAEDPKGLKVDLMPHQRRALAWLMFRENQKPSGGILADDMGLGKTLTMIALMLKMNETERGAHSDSDEENDDGERGRKKFNGGTLVVCPASLLNQWSGELENRAKRGLASCNVYHGPKREKKAKILSEYDMVVTTYSIVQNEHDNGTIFRVRWRRIVLDEAHQIRNHKSLTSIAVCNLSGKSRWALTGTPIHNKELDMFALLKFLRCSPFDDLQVWRRWVGDKSTGGVERLHTVISSLMLRRTKAELMEKGSLNCMPERKWELIPVNLDKVELVVYQKVNLFSRTLFAQFLHQRAQKNQDIYDANYAGYKNPKDPNNEYFKMRDKLLRMNNIQDISQHHILVLLLRLRQICCHPSLITAMLNETDDVDPGEEMEELNILDQLSKLNLDEDEYDPNAAGPSEDGKGSLKEASKGLLNPSNPVFSVDHLSSKIKMTLDVLQERVLPKGDKAIIVSQFPSFLRIVGKFLSLQHIPFEQLDGSVPVHKRMEMVDSFNNETHKMKVMLLSLTAGGVGLNLIGANHLFLLDLHWNPQLENQAQDRIYRVGQKKPVFVYKFMATDTIEERIKSLQDSKLECASAMLTGSKQVTASKLSLQDLKMLFDMQFYCK